jgi:hypothetical protein
VNLFVRNADDDKRVPKVDKGLPKYITYKFTDEEWAQMKLILKVLEVRVLLPIRLLSDSLLFIQPTVNLQQQFSSETEPTIWRIIASFEDIFTEWEEKMEDPKYSSIAPAIKLGWDTFRKYYVDTDRSDVAVISMSKF